MLEVDGIIRCVCVLWKVSSVVEYCFTSLHERGVDETFAFKDGRLHILASSTASGRLLSMALAVLWFESGQH